MKKTYLLLTLIIVTLFPLVTYASHAQGADLAYRFISYNSLTGVTKYYVTATFYRDCSGIPADSTMMLIATNTSCSGGGYAASFALPRIDGLACPFGGVSGANGCEVSHLCNAASSQSTCNGGSTYPGMQKYVYADTISLAGNGTVAYLCSQWTISIDINARNPSTNLNAATGDLYLEAVINNTIDPLTGAPYQNSSPVFQNDPVPFACVASTTPTQYNNAGSDADGDSLVYTLTAPLQGHNTPVAFNTGYTVSNPIASNPPCAVNGATGILTFTPTQTEIDALAFLVEEYRHGVLVGSTRRDVEIKLLNCNSIAPVFGLPVVQGGVANDSTSVSACPGDHLTVDIPVISATGSNVSLHSSIDQFPGSYSGMTFSQVSMGINMSAHIEWQSVDTVCRYVYIQASSNDCPVASSSFDVIKICGRSAVKISPASPVYCGHTVSLTATGGDNPVWSPATGLSTTTGLLTMATPAVSTWYHFRSDCATDSVYVKVGAPIVSHISRDTAVCNGFPIQLTENVSTAGSYTYAWNPAIGLYDPITGVTNTIISNPIAKAGVSTLYHCLVTDTSGCVIEDTVRITINGTGRLVLTADTLIAQGAQTNLSAALSPAIISSSILADTSVSEIARIQVGRGTTIQGGTAFLYPSPLGNYSKSARHQLLFKASELNALFGGSRVISSFRLQIGILNSGVALHDFTIKIGTTNADSLTQYEGGNALMQVYTDTSYTPVLGWNTFVFQNAYVWDGVSDLIVDMCFTNTTYNNINSKMVYTITPFRSIYWSSGNAYSMCGVTGLQSSPPSYASFFQRPNVQFGVAIITAGLSNLSWSPASGANAVDNTNSAFTSATVTTDQWYKATLADAVCVQFDSIFVRVISSGTHTPQNTTLCLGDSMLFAAHNGNSYTWSDVSGILSTSSAFYYKPTHTSDVVLVMTDTGGHIISDTSHIVVLDQRVWPGDGNDDGVIDNNDVLPLGIAFGDTGSARPNASFTWIGQCAASWDSTFSTGVNCVHADYDGDGRVGYADTLALYANWGLTHAKTNADRQGAYAITITTDKTLYHLNDTIKATISLGDNATPIPQLYGIAYQFDYTGSSAAHIIGVDQSVSWLDRKLDFKKITSTSKVYLAQSRTDHHDVSGYGPIAEIRLVVDLANALDSAYLNIGSVLALTSRGDTVSVGTASKTVAVTSTPSGIETISTTHAIDIYPNPSNGLFRIMQSYQEKANMSMTDAIGREVYTRTISDKVTNVDLSALPEGIYIATFSTGSGKSSKRIIITK